MSLQPISAENQFARNRNWKFSKTPPAAKAIDFNPAQSAVVEHEAGGLLVLGGPGTGKTEVLAAAIAARLQAGAGPDSILVLTFNHAAAAELKSRITLLTGGGLSPQITTFHSFGLNLLQEFSEYSEAPTLITAAAQEVLLKELIQGILQEPVLRERVRIHPELLPALSTKAMLVEIRNAIARAQVLGMTPMELAAVAGADANWVMVADIYREYLEQLVVQNVLDYNQLVTELLLLLQDESVRNRIQSRYRYVFLDEYQDIDPLHVRVISEVVNPQGSVVALADPDQAIYKFRGAEESAVLSFVEDFSQLQAGSRVIRFEHNYRALPEIQSAVEQVIERNSDYSYLSKYQMSPRGAVSVAKISAAKADVRLDVYETAEAEAEAIANQIREVVLGSNGAISFSDVAVLVRSGSRSIPTLQQALLSADVPVNVVFDEIPLAEETVVRILLSALELVHNPSKLKDPFVARDILTSPLSNFSTNELRHLGRELKRVVNQPGAFSEQLIADALADVDFEIEPRDLQAQDLLRRVRNLHDLFNQSHRALRNGSEVAEILWSIWNSPVHNWPNELRSKALATGYGASIANHSLDAIRTLFKVATDTAAAVKSHTSIPNFIAELKAMEVSSQKTMTAIKPDAVSLMTAHRAKGKEWLVVFVASVDEGSWPDTSRRSSIFAPDRLTRNGLGFLPERYEIVADERRLLYTAISRARAILRVSSTAADPDSGRVVSRFLKSFENAAPFQSDTSKSKTLAAGAFSPMALVAQLRRVATDIETSEGLRTAATAKLLELAQLRDAAGRLLVPAAHPAAWWGIAAITTNSIPILAETDPVYVRGSSFADLLNCPLNWFMKQKAAADVGSSVAANFGSIVHALAAGVIDGEISNNEIEIAEKLEQHWGSLRYSADWESAAQKSEAIRSIRNFLIWREGRLPDLVTDQKAEYSERFFDANVPFPLPDGRIENIKLRGSIDILQVQADGQIFIADIKTSSSATSVKDTQTNPQLGVYQKAVSLGLVQLEDLAVSQKLESAGAALLFVRDKQKTTPGPTVRIQTSLNEAETDWMDENFRIAIDTVRSENHTPVVSDSCKYCPIKSSCPTQAQGKSVI